MSEKVNINVKIDKQLKEDIITIANKDDRTLSYVVVKAIEEYVRKWKA